MQAAKNGDLDIEERTPENAMSLAEEIRQLRSEVKRLNKENKRLQEERDFLNEAAAFSPRAVEVNKQERMKFIALKTCDGGAKGRISFCCKALKVTRQERMHKALLLKFPDSVIPSETTVYRVMTAIGITHRPNRKPNGITKADREARKSDDLLKRDFKADKPFSKCVTDITEIKAKNGKQYVSAIFDCYDLTAVGLSMDDNMRAELCAATVENTAAAYPEFCGAVLHSDCGKASTQALHTEPC